jgi:hypothetical protein
MTIMVALVGEQPLPNLLPVRHDHPDGVLLIYTSRTAPVYNRLKATLAHETTVYGRETVAYDIVQIEKDLQSALAAPALADHPLVFNFTSGTKAMSLAAYQVAQRHDAPLLYLESEGKRNRIYHYTWVDRQLQPPSSELLPECVTLDDIFDVHLGPGEWHEQGPSRSEGGPFEAALAEALRSHGYEDVMVGIKAMDGQIDIDVAVRFENQFGIIEAKTGNSGRKLDGIKQLNNNLRQLGTYTKAFYVITVPCEQAHEAISKASRIQIISLPGFVSGMDRLSPDDTSTLITAVDEQLKG